MSLETEGAGIWHKRSFTFISAPPSDIFRDCHLKSTCELSPRASVQVSTRVSMRAEAMSETTRISGKAVEERHVLVTGATGFLGSHLVEALAANGYQVHSLSRKPLSSSIKSLQPDRHYTCDLTQAGTTLGEILQQRSWHAVIHLAGLVSYTPKDAGAMEAINVVATKQLVAEMIAHCPSTKLLFCSSVVSVGSNVDKGTLPINEEQPWDTSLQHIGYVRTKRQAEEMVRKAGQTRQLPTACICPSNIFGAGDYKKSSRKTQIKAANGKQRIYTYGGVSIVHVSVVVELFLRVLQCDSNDGSVDQNEVWNGSRWLATGDNITIKQMLGLFAEKGGNQRYAPWLALPNWLLIIFCFIGQLLGSSSMTMERYQLATRYHWYDGSRARQRFGLRAISADIAIGDSVGSMIENGVVRPR